MKVEAERAHETTWAGDLTGEQAKDLLIKALRDHLGTPLYGMKLLVLKVGDHSETEMPSFRYLLVHDHDWHLKPTPGEDEPS